MNGNNPQPPQQQNPFVQMGLGPMFQPSPIGWAWHRLQAIGAPTICVLVMFSTDGVQGFCIPEDKMDEFIKQAQACKSGLVL